MASNTTTDSLWQFQIIYFIWIMEFLFIGLGNALIAFAILRYEALRDRKEYLIIFGLCLADFLNLASYLFAGIFRSFLIVFNEFDTVRPALECLILPHSLCWLFFEPLASLMLLVLSIDRLIAIASPLKYIGFNRHYAYILLFITYGYCIGFGIVVLIIGFLQRDLRNFLSAPCYIGQAVTAVGKQLAWYWMTQTPIYGALSIVVYALMGLLYWHKRNLAVSDVNLQAQEERFQRRLTKSLSISCFCTFCFAVVPTALAYGGEVLSFPRLLMQLLWLLPNLNPGCNVCIFVKRHAEILEALKAMITCKQMPIDIRLWKANAQAQETMAQ